MEPFFNAYSAQLDQIIRLDDGTVEYELDMEVGFKPFVLDASKLDGDDRLL